MRYTKLSPHFSLAEFIPNDTPESHVPVDVHASLEELALNILEPVRETLCVPLHITSGWRPPAHNAAVGGKPHSDHLTGNAADFHPDPIGERTWQESTIYAFQFIRTQMDGRFGQLILEDHRTFYHNPAKLWVHVSNPTKTHPGTPDDINRILLSWSPTNYAQYDPKKVPIE